MRTRRLRDRLRAYVCRPSTAVAALWTVIAVRRARRTLRDQGFAARVLPPPPLPRSAGRGVSMVLRRIDRTCLERAMVEQAWLVSQGEPVDVVIGVAADEGQVKAHAWIAGRTDRESTIYREIHRITPRTSFVT